MSIRGSKSHARLLCSAASAALLLYAGAANAQTELQDPRRIDIAPQSLASALHEFGVQSGHQVLFKSSTTLSKTSPGATADGDMDAALTQLLAGTGMSFRRAGDVFLIEPEGGSDPQSESAAGDGADGTVDALIVTAQKREEDIQDVPIAISAFSQETLERSQVAGGPDLMTQVPNMTFTKTNFSSYSIQIRGIGTQAISATTDAAVAVAFNNTPFIRNRFFEQEFYDVERVEVLRGPQGTLYGRNATAGVVNIISAKPKFQFEAKLSADVANYGSTRLEGMVNFPLVDDAVAVRLAGAWTKREGFVTNEITGNPIDGRDLWSGRASVRIQPSDRWSVDFIYEHFEEDDDRLRSGKQLCKKHYIGEFDGQPVPQEGAGGAFGIQTYLSQGCLPASLYGDESFETPNGFALPFFAPLANAAAPLNVGFDPYINQNQSRDLRVIESTVDPEYRARTDVVEIQASYDLTDTLTIASETAYSYDTIFSMQDYNRFNTRPGIFRIGAEISRPGMIDENGVFCDPQMGCSDRLVLVDLSTAKSQHFSQEFRLSSDFDGAFNFSLGANFLRYDTEDKYYVFINTLSMFAVLAQGWENDIPYVPGVTDNSACQAYFAQADLKDPYGVESCIYIDPNPIGRLNDQGRNYFLSRNPYRLISYATFGELYYSPTPDVNITAGLRWTVDRKHAPRIPTWLLASYAAGPYPVDQVIDQEWNEPTGRLTVDWRPDLAFTDETLLYGSIAHGYKAGGANPPPPVFADYAGNDELVGEALVSHATTFEPEFINAFEIGAKNTLADGHLTLNLTAFYYDYTGYQISEIRDRQALNSNYDAEVWGAELEVDWRPLENLRLGLKGGYQGTRIGDGERAVDLIDRTAGDPQWTVVRPFPTIPSNCIVPTAFLEGLTLGNIGPYFGADSTGSGPCATAFYHGLPVVFDPGGLDVGFHPDDVPNNGVGVYKDLGGNELPNAPNFTTTITADYTLPLPNDWLMTLHTDLYYQSEAWTRIFNMEGYDKLKAYTNVNLAAIFTNEDAGWKVMAYVKNVFDRDSITGAFLNSDDTGLTTNVFLTEPRLYGLRVTKDWSGGAPMGAFGQRRDGAYPFRVSIGGGPTRLVAEDEMVVPEWVDTFISEAPYPLEPQNQERDWGDDREASLIYAPVSWNGWLVAVGARIGRSNGSAFDDVLNDTGYTCLLYDYFGCGKTSRSFGNFTWGATEAHDTDRFTIVDFVVGREFGIGMGEGSRSVVNAGIRYAEFETASVVETRSEPDHIFPESNAWKYDRDFHTFHERFTADRKFSGVGPAVSWDAFAPLLGDALNGRLGLDWSVGGGVLFGRQKVSSRYRIVEHATTGTILFDGIENIALVRDETTPRDDSEGATVPNVNLSLGLAYEVDRFKVGAGYRWERYFDAIDGGIAEPRSFDRDFHGPYFKLSVGFGG